MPGIAAAAQLLAHNRRTKSVIDNLPTEFRPTDLTAAYHIQDALVTGLLQDHGGQLVGYKIACTNETAQRLLDVATPIFGRLLSSRVFDHPSRLTAGNFRVRCVEPEYGFRIAVDVPYTDVAYSRESIAKYVDAVLPSIEIVDHHFTDWSAVGGFVLAADNAIHSGWIRGKEIRDFAGANLETELVHLVVNDRTVATGCGANVLGSPLAALAWLANELPRFGHQLCRGDLVTTGVVTDVYLAEAGDTIRADFGAVGLVEVAFT